MAKAKKATRDDLKRVDSAIAGYRGRRWALIPLLHEIQGELGYIPPGLSIAAVEIAALLFLHDISGQ